MNRKACILFICILLMVPIRVHAIPSVLSLALEVPAVKVNESNSLHIRLSNLKEIYGLHIKLKFDPQVLDFNQIDLNQSILEKDHFVAVKAITTATGEIELMLTLLGDTPSLNSSSIIASLPFQALQSGNTEVAILESTLLTRDGRKISYDTQNVSFAIKTTSEGISRRHLKSTISDKNTSTDYVFTLMDKVVVLVPKEALANEATLRINESTSNIYHIDYSHLPSGKIKVSFNTGSFPSDSPLGIYYLNTERNQWLYLGGTREGSYLTEWIKPFDTLRLQIIPNYKEYTDIEGCQAEESIKKLTALGIVNGINETSFAPNDPITRGQIAKVFSLALYLQDTNYPQMAFHDRKVIPNWASDYVNNVVSNGIMKGYDDATFRPQGYITRLELVVMLDRILDLPQSQGESLAYSDAASIPSWGKESVMRLASMKLIKPYEDGSFRPNQPTTRAELCAAVVQMLEAMGII